MSATHRVHVLSLDSRPQIWLDTEIAECDGICLGTGDTLAEAKEDAIEELAAALARVQAIDPATYPLLSREWTDDAKRRRALNDAAPDLLAACRGVIAEFTEWEGPEETPTSPAARARNQAVRAYAAVAAAIALAEATS